MDVTEEQNARDIADIRLDLRANMVRKDVYDVHQAAVAKDIAESVKDIVSLDAKFEKSEERRAADRRLILTALVLPIVTALILLYVQSQIGGK